MNDELKKKVHAYNRLVMERKSIASRELAARRELENLFPTLSPTEQSEIHIYTGNYSIGKGSRPFAVQGQETY